MVWFRSKNFQNLMCARKISKKLVSSEMILKIQHVRGLKTGYLFYIGLCDQKWSKQQTRAFLKFEFS